MDIGNPIKKHVVIPAERDIPETPEPKIPLPEKAPEKQPAKEPA
jgi:hypothetical protein